METIDNRTAEDAPSEASTIVLAASPSPSRLTSLDVARAAADPLVVSSTAGSAAAPPQPKQQWHRKDGDAATRGPSSDMSFTTV